MSKTLGVLGGMGPEATADLFKKIVNYTAAEKDQEHIHIIVEDNAKIPDRTSYILGKGENPVNDLIETAMRLKLMGADIIVMPCNTAHYFLDEIKKVVDVSFINMIDEVAKYILNRYKNDEVGLLATKGTYEGRVYEKYFQKYNINIVQPSGKYKSLISELIYQVKKGVKSFKTDLIKEMLNEFKDKGIKTIVLGCTELPILFDNLHFDELKEFNFISSTDILARRAVKMASDNKLI
ncbi:cysteate racemase [Clostridium brassicae]|uniref:Amino acid racemase n=1 Tax=Clostridium brassicae TaxID=2999072 RepID=A0ABT4D941_9CLOT|nr:amino acid racemase [Clostridium brassicae]MCY6957756.1 amino acid racemase [Clostridium brassicae]